MNPKVPPPFLPRFLPTRLPRVCVAVVGTSPAAMIEKAETIVRDNPFIEFRLDYLTEPEKGFHKLKGFIDFHPEALLLATCRRASNGGKFRGSVAAQVNILVKTAQLGFQLVDIELESARKMKPEDFERVRRQAALILSSHDYEGTSDLEETFKKMQAFPADFYKVVSTAKSLHDNVTMMKFLEAKSDKNSMVGLCMGEQGIISRILGVRAGSAFTFGAALPGEETGPGQITGRTLHNTYRIEQVDTATRVYGVAGDPVAHSLSPQMMNAAFRRENLNAVYLALHAKSLADLMACVRDIPIHGLSVTLPYKEQILQHLDNTEPLTAKIGACNTVIRAQDGKLYGFNTDVAGVVRPLENRITLAGSRILVLGAGGAARAAVFGLKERGAEVFVLNRTPAAGQKLARQAHAKSITRLQLKKLQFDVIINATSSGMEGDKKPAPLAESELKATYLFDMVYNPAETKLVKMARARGLQIIPGWEMLLHQGARQFEIWSGKPAPVEDMQRVVVHALQAATS